AGDVDAAFRALEPLAKEFEVDGLALRVAALTTAAPAAKTPAAHQALAETGLDLIDEAGAGEKFEAGLGALNGAEAAGETGESPALTTRVKARGDELRALVKEYEAVKTARAKLKDSPDDDKANLVVGKFLSLRLGDWDRGLPLLAKGADAKFKTQAENDLAKP